jgi:hypothetical protein
MLSIKSPTFETMNPIKSNSRGARFLDLVRNNKINVSPQLMKKVKHSNLMSMKREEGNNSNNRDYLKLSTEMPDLTSSPSNSILSKRKAMCESTPESPMNNSAKVSRLITTTNT